MSIKNREKKAMIKKTNGVPFLLGRTRVIGQFFLGTRIPYKNMNCHPARPGVPWKRSGGTCGSLHQ